LPFGPFLLRELVCPECGITFEAPVYWADKRRYCSLPCKHKGQSKTTRAPLVVRFWAKVDKLPGDTACWEWIGSHDGRGYGTINPGGTGASPLKAPRVALAWQLGRPLLPGMSALHHCDNPPCVRNDGPLSHLFEGTHVENMADMHSKGRGVTGRPSLVAGESHTLARLTPEVIYEARQRHAAGVASMSALAREYGVSRTTLRHALSGKTWKHLL
jgi:hypothetical protein